MSEVITQVQSGPQVTDGIDQLPELFYLDLRGQRFRLTRETLLGLPESIIFSLSGGFNMGPEPLVPQPPTEQHEHVNHSNESFYQSPRDDEHELTPVDFDPKFLNYVLDTYHKYADDLSPAFIPLGDFPEFHGFVEAHATIIDSPDSSVPELALEPQILMDPDHTPKVLEDRPSLIVLKEDIEYYCIAPEVSDKELQRLKVECGDYLVRDKSIFRDLLKSQVFKPNLSPAVTGASNYTETDKSPEYHLVKMLNLAGLGDDTEWAIREREPYKTSITSLQLSPLKVPKDGDLEAIHAVQKLLLFWKKPARKCWWSHTSLTLRNHEVQLHVRKVWTLELSILGIKV